MLRGSNVSQKLSLWAALSKQLTDCITLNIHCVPKKT